MRFGCLNTFLVLETKDNVGLMLVGLLFAAKNSSKTVCSQTNCSSNMLCYFNFMILILSLKQSFSTNVSRCQKDQKALV